MWVILIDNADLLNAAVRTVLAGEFIVLPVLVPLRNIVSKSGLEPPFAVILKLKREVRNAGAGVPDLTGPYRTVTAAEKAINFLVIVGVNDNPVDFPDCTALLKAKAMAGFTSKCSEARSRFCRSVSRLTMNGARGQTYSSLLEVIRTVFSSEL